MPLLSATIVVEEVGSSFEFKEKVLKEKLPTFDQALNPWSLVKQSDHYTKVFENIT